ncbi:MAG: ABC transporter ATP-binding protein [Clostridiales bacterium]|nr:ABC transporter ATP-binding protein [Clostridiales bacterium]
MLLYAKKYWKYLTIAIAGLIGLTSAQLYAPWVVRKLITLITEKSPDLGRKALQFAITLVFVYLGQAICVFLRSYFSHLAAWNFVSDMRIRMYEHLQKLSLRFYHDKQTGQLMSRTSNDTASLEAMIAHAAPDMIVNLLLFGGVSTILFNINWQLALLCLSTMPFIIFVVSRFAKKVLPRFKFSQQALAEFNATLHDNISGIKEIQVFNRQREEHGRITKYSMAYVKSTLDFLKLSAVYHPSIEFFNNMGLVIVIGFGGYLAWLGKVPLQDIITFILYLGMFYQPISNFGRINEDLQNSLAGASRIFEILDTESDVKEKADAKDIPKAKGALSFADVNFQYINGFDILKDINLEIKAGEMIALVGPTGVGKTTLASLICRFYDPTSGKITLDGVDIRDITLRSLRDNLSIVLQDVFLFNDTVYENIAYGAPGATKEDIERAAVVAHADEFIRNLEKGYDTIIGERGIKISGGQKQRLSIARAVLRNSSVLILDEATASVDTETEKLIHDAMDKVMENRTTIIIAHRLSSIMRADKIVVVNEGRIEELGTHSKLLAGGGLYSRLCKVQFRDDTYLSEEEREEKREEEDGNEA